MGIQGLLPLLKSIMNPIHIRELEGCSVAVDTYSWLHKGALSCSTELCKGLPTSKHIDYCMHRVNMLRHYGIRLILVFDGGPLPMKGDQETKRARSRRENLSRAMEHESNGNKTAAYECYQKAVDISPLMAYDLIKVLKQENVSYIVAPYEADAQMTFLALNKQVEAVITEDSDLIAFGCPRIIYKMDKFGQGVEFKNAMIQQNKDLNLAGFTQMMLLEMCILSGCDYLQSLPGMGLKKAHALIKRFRSHEKVIKHLQYNGVELTPLYEESFKKAIFTFRHQRVYDPVTEGLVHLSEPAHVIDDDFEFLGPSMPQHVAKGIALGVLDPFTKNPIQGETGDADVVTRGIYQLKNFKPDGEKKRLDLPVQKNLLTNYFCFASVEAKQKFMAPRITPKHPNEHNRISSPQLYETNQDMSTDNLDSPESLDHGLYDETREINSVCKPCTSLHKNRETEPENEKAGVGNKNVIVRSSYFMQKPRESICDLRTNSDTKFENIISSFLYKPQSALPDGKCKNVEKRVVRSSYFQHKNSNGNYNSETENIGVDCPVTKNRFGSGAGDCKVTVETGKDQVRSPYFLNITANEDAVKPASEDIVTRCNVTTETCNDSVSGRLSDNSLSGCATRKRKLTQTDSSMEEENCTSPTSGICTSEQEEEAKAEEGQFGCNISHLSRYSGIAEKSMENFVSVISSFRYNSSGSRASGLRRPPLKDIKNNCIESSTPAVDLSRFVYVPTKKTTAPPRGRKANF